MLSIKTPANYASEFREAGYKIFPLHPILEGRGCGCYNPECKAAGKHPISTGWQHTPVISEQELDAQIESDLYDSGYGIICDGIVVLDFDARNGGNESHQRLLEKVPKISGSGLIVETGSGGGSKHFYFKIPEGVSLVSKHHDYAGLDIKTSGFVVGAGSKHVSGNKYKIVAGSVADIDYAPPELIELLLKPEFHRKIHDDRAVDVSDELISSLLDHIDPDTDYDTWIKCGMAIHDATDGTGEHHWDIWSSRGTKYEGQQDIANHWYSFGKSTNPVRLGTLIYLAQENGWEWPVTFDPHDTFDEETEQEAEQDIDISNIDLKKPPSLVGELTVWINDQCRYDREHIAVAAALVSVGNIVGLKYADELDDISTNLIILIIAGSGTGKEAIFQAFLEIMKAAGLSKATHGSIKSEQEIVRNLLRNQAAFYGVDEIGFLLTKIKGAQKSGGAVYLEGVIGLLMAAYSKANSWMPISGDVRETAQKELLVQIKVLDQKIEAGDTSPNLKDQVKWLEQAVLSLDEGLEKPFISLFGATTPITFEAVVDHQNAINGFIGRSLLVIEQETVPDEKIPFKKRKMPEELKDRLARLYTANSFDVFGGFRIEHRGQKIIVPTSPEAERELRKAMAILQRLATEQKSKSGLEALFLRAKEQVAKISFILAVPDGMRTVEHVRWAYAFVRRDLNTKRRLVVSNDNKRYGNSHALQARIISLLENENGEVEGTIVNRLRPVKRDEIEKALQDLLTRKIILVEQGHHLTTKMPFKRYKLAALEREGE